MKWTIQDDSPRKYPHYDPGTSRQLLCDQCPPGSYVKQHCTASSPTQCAPCPDQYYAEEWNSNDECQYCSAVCKELQYVKQECTPTQDRLCQCVEGRYLELEFCLKHTECPPGFGVAQPGMYRLSIRTDLIRALLHVDGSRGTYKIRKEARPDEIPGQ